MARVPKPWWRKDRKSWFVTIAGRRHRLGPDREAAHQLFHELMARPKQQPVSSNCVVAIIDAFLDWTKLNRAQRTFDWYLERTQSFAGSIPSHLTVSQFKPFHVQQWLDSHPNWSNSTKRGSIIAVKRALNWAVKFGHIERNPIDSIEKPEAGRREQTIMPKEFERILAHVRDQEFRDLLNTAWDVGARPQELLRVEARHVDLENCRWVFPKCEAKGKRQIRIVYLSEQSLEITKRLMLKHPDGTLFRNTKGRSWTAFAVNCRFQNITTPSVN